MTGIQMVNKETEAGQQRKAALGKHGEKKERRGEKETGGIK